MRTLGTLVSLSKPASRRLGAAAVLLLASGLIHLVVQIAVGGEWAGPVSLRKPITFGLSMGMLLWTVGWVLDRLPSRPRLERALGLAMAVSGVVEVGLISAQAWRGVPSHFNYATPQDVAVFAAMGLTIAVLSVGLVVTTVWAFAQPPVEPSIRLAVRAGMLLILTGLGVGQWMIELGNDFVERFDRVPDKLLAGAEGVPTFPHAMAFHGIQAFILAALLAGLVGLHAQAAQRVVRLVVAGYSVLLVWSIVQAAGGTSPVALLRPATALAVLGVGLLAAAAALLLIGWRRAERQVDPRGTEPHTAVPSTR